MTMQPLSPRPAGAILYVGARLPALSETFVYRELLGLRSRGRTVQIASVRRPGRFVDDPALTALAEEATVVYAWRTVAVLPLALLLHARLLLSAFGEARRADYLSLSGRAKHMLQAAMGIGLGWRLRSRRITHVHAHMANVPSTIALYAARALDARFSFTGHAADLFIGPVALDLKLRQAAFVACISHWHQAYYGAAVPSSPDRRPLVRCSVALPGRVESERQEVVVVARLVAKKGIDMLIDAFAAAGPEGWILRVLGDGPERDALVARAAERGVAGRVLFEGARPHAACLAALATAGIVALPCRTAANHDRDGIPVVLMEAMAAARAVIAGDLPTIRELIADGETGLLAPPDDVAALAALLRCLGADPVLRQRLGRAAREAVAAEFADNINLDRLEAAFDAAA